LPEIVFIELGSNIAPEVYLPRAVASLEAVGRILSISNAYQNPAISKTTQPDYINAAVMIETSLYPLELRERLRSIEEKLDRVRTEDKYAPRTIDLDIVLYGETVVDHPLLKIPDEHIYTRPHLAVTLAECAPEYVHPLTGETLSAIADQVNKPGLLVRRDDLDLTSKLDAPPRNYVS
jgi:2-amino-4-hydroxy-6-hydroxymethyldihydropteridine diphosphokinase